MTNLSFKNIITIVLVALIAIPATFLIVETSASAGSYEEGYDDGFQDVTVSNLEYDHVDEVVTATLSNGVTLNSASTYQAIYDEGYNSVGFGSYTLDHTNEWVEITLDNGVVIEESTLYNELYTYAYDEGFSAGEQTGSNLALTVSSTEPTSPTENEIWVKSDTVQVDNVRIDDDDTGIADNTLWLRHVQRKPNALGYTLDINGNNFVSRTDISRAGSVWDGTEWVLPEMFIWTGTEWYSLYYGESNVYYSFYGELTKTNALGEVIWSESPANGITNLTVDADGYLYTIYDNNRIRSFNPDGSFRWDYNEHTDTINDIEVDSLGNIYSASNDNTLHKISSDGNQLWTFTGSSSDINALAVNNSNNYVYAGLSTGDIYEVDDVGNFVSSYTDHTTAINSLALDSQNIIYSASDNGDLRILDTSLNLLGSYSNTLSTVDEISLASDNEIFVMSTIDEEVHKIDSEGNLIWVYDVGFQPYSISNSPGGYLYVSYGNPYEVHKVDSNNNLVWSISNPSNTIASVASDPGSYGTFYQYWNLSTP